MRAAGIQSLHYDTARRPSVNRFARAAALALAFTVVAVAAPVRAQSSLQRELRTILASKPHAGAQAGACVIDLATGKTVFDLAADVPLLPASSAKLFTMAAAVVELGEDFSFETHFATDGENLYVIGDGDPAVGDEKTHRARGEAFDADLSRWGDVLVSHGVSTVPGDLIIDDSIFDDQRLHPSWEQGDLGKWYAAGVGGLNFNDNCIDITVSPASQAGAPALVSYRPETSLVEIVNKCRTGGSGNPVLHHPHDTYQYRISGRCKKRWPFSPVSFPDPGLLLGDSLRTSLAKKGIRIEGRLKRGRVRLADGRIPDSLTVLARRTTPLADVLKRAGKDSQNLFAECLIKRVGYAVSRRREDVDPRGTWALGAKAVTRLIARAGIDTRGLVVADGSGLSRDNRCTPRQLASLLTWINGQPGGSLLRDNLSVAGVDGSLRKRLKDVPGRVQAKTGTMRGVRTLAGYLTSSNGEPRFAFAIMFNGYKGPSTPYREIQDRACRVLIDVTNAGS